MISLRNLHVHAAPLALRSSTSFCCPLLTRSSTADQLDGCRFRAEQLRGSAHVCVLSGDPGDCVWVGNVITYSPPFCDARSSVQVVAPAARARSVERVGCSSSLLGATGGPDAFSPADEVTSVCSHSCEEACLGLSSGRGLPVQTVVIYCIKKDSSLALAVFGSTTSSY